MKRVILSLIISFTLIAVLLCGFFIFRDVYLTYQAQIEEKPSEEPTEPGGEDKPNDEPEEPTEPGGEDKPSDEPEEPEDPEDLPYESLSDFYGGYALCEMNEEGVYEVAPSISTEGGLYNFAYYLNSEETLTPYYWLYRGTNPTTMEIKHLSSSEPTYSIAGIEKISNGFKLKNEEGVEIIMYSPLLENDYNYEFNLTSTDTPTRVLIIDGVVYADLGYEWRDVDFPTVSIEKISELFGTYYHCNLENGAYVKDTSSGAEIFKFEGDALQRSTLNIFGNPMPLWTVYLRFEGRHFKQTEYNIFTCPVNETEFVTFYLGIRPVSFETAPSKVLIIGDEIYACFD